MKRVRLLEGDEKAKAQGEYKYFEHLLDLYPTGILSIVSDTWDLWKVLTDYLPRLKAKILARDGKLVIRPDSGNPVDILCGRGSANLTPSEEKGVIQLLWEVFGGTVNSKGYKVLDPHIGAIYGDSITYDRAKAIFRRLERKGYASSNVVLGIGSYTYQYVTRDTYGFAMKATQVKVNGELRDIFKDPITDDGTKKSAKGRLQVIPAPDKRDLAVVDQVSMADEEDSLLEVVFENGLLLKYHNFNQIRNTVRNQLYKLTDND